MATSKSKGGGPDIRFDEFIKQIRPQPGSAEQIVMIQGYVGESDKDDQVRIYSDESLSEYIDISRADILYSLAEERNPLGGSRLWVKQSANVNYNDAYAQGDMYNDYMQNSYAGSEAFGPGIATIVNCPGPILTRPQICVRPSQFICPTPASRLIICTIQKTIFCPVTITRSPIACGGPSLVDGCPSALGCTIDRTRVINPVGGGFADEYSGGDMYGDYMQNTYDGNFGDIQGQLLPTVQLVCQPRSLQFLACKTLTINLNRTKNIYCITLNKQLSLCQICPPMTQNCPGAVDKSQQFFDEYATGDMYGDYMQNTYDGSAGAGGTAAFGPLTNGQVICAQQISLQVVCQSVYALCPTRKVLCWLTRDGRRTICRPCYEITPTITRTPQSIACNPGIPGNPGNPIGGGGQFNDEYGAGDLYGDYMQNTYSGGAGTEAFGPTTNAQVVCAQQISLQVVCQSVINICPTRQIWCRLTRNNIRTICRPCFEITPTITRTPQSIACNPGIPGNPGNPIGGGGQFNDEYGGGDLYGDYMQNTYDGGAGDISAAGVTTTVICMQPISLQYICVSRPIYACPTQRIQCWLTRDGRRTICRPCFEITPTITRTPQSIACNPGIPGNPIGGGGQYFESDYSGGDIYGDYMQNMYDGGVGDTAAAAITTTAVCAVTRPAVCIIATSPIICRRTIQLTIAICCRVTISPALCRTRVPQYCFTAPSLCCVSRPPACPLPSLPPGCGLQTVNCPSLVCGAGNPNDPYGY